MCQLYLEQNLCELRFVWIMHQCVHMNVAESVILIAVLLFAVVPFLNVAFADDDPSFIG